MNLRTLALCAAVAASFAFGSVQAKEPVEPQPATPLTYVNPARTDYRIPGSGSRP